MSELLNSQNAQAAEGQLTGQALEDYDRLRDDCGLIELGAWSTLELTGEDRKGWLQGQASNELRRFDSGASTAFCFCSPTGHMVSSINAWALKDRFVFSFEKAAKEAVLDRIHRMVILEDVVAEDVAKKYRGLSIQGPNASRKLALLTEMPNLDAGEAELDGVPILLLRSDRNGLGGWDILLPAARRKVLETLRLAFPAIDPQALGVARLEAGIPRYGADYDERTLPPELGSAFEARHISYSKGCYTGQEVLMRIHSRGHTNRTWVGLLAEAPLEQGAPVNHRVKKEIGKITSCAHSPDFGPIGAAYLRNEYAEDREDVTVQTSQGPVPAVVRRMPLLRF